MRIVIITGEASGDMYGSLLARELKRLAKDVQLAGVGGQSMRAAGVDIFLDSSSISVVGIWEAIVRLGSLRRAMNRIKARIASLRPDLLVLIDYPGMNLRLACFAKRLGIKVMYYVSPQVWAWGRSRIRTVKKCVDKMVVILPFEAEIYRREGVDVTYVGHPLIDIVKTGLDRDSFLAKHGLSGERRRVALLSGSRRQEIRQHLEPLLGAAAILSGKLGDLDFVMVTLPEFEGMVRDAIARSGLPVRVITDFRYEAIAYSDLAIMCSGTVTLEGALLGTPMIVIYRLSPLSWAVGRMIIRVPYISLVNLVAREEVVREFIQGEAQAEPLATEALRILSDEPRRRHMIGRLQQVRSQLGAGNATSKAAEIALSLARQ
ncbi:MAG TPA: lipid-A-disaccharide synthase [bacterium]|nr:lipid-A-disaccharide synthase [bacterium]